MGVVMDRKAKILELHKDNPNIYEAFEKKALQVFRERKYYSARFIIEFLRWDTTEGTDDRFKVNNDFSVFCSRLFIKRFPKYKDKFSFRTSVFDDKDLDQAQLDMFK